MRKTFPIGTNIIWRQPVTCPQCSKTAFFSAVREYIKINSEPGSRTYCAHCGYVEIHSGIPKAQI